MLTMTYAQHADRDPSRRAQRSDAIAQHARRDTTARHRPRRGSVLILVIALLVLMALIGTAFITTATTDRLASSQHTNNTQIELIAQGILAAETSKIASGVLIGKTAKFRAPEGEPYGHYEATGVARNEDNPPADQALGSAFLATRIPETREGLRFGWPYISGSPIAGNPNLQFGSPLSSNGGAVKDQEDLAGVSGLAHGYANAYGVRRNIAPSWIDVPLPGGRGTQRMPAIIVNVNADPKASPNYRLYLGGDADGDGIADGALFRVPIGQINGVTYWASVRTIDNNSAVNAAIANEAGSFNVTPVNVDLSGMIGPNPGPLPSNTDMQKLLLYRNGNIPVSNTKPQDDDKDGDGKGEERADFNYNSQTTAYWFQCGRRLDNPGFNSNTARYYGLPISESMSLANRFCLASPSGGSMIVENALTQAANAAVRRAPFSPKDVAAWSNLFQYAPVGDVNDARYPAVPPTASIRPLLTARNAVSNYTPAAADSTGFPGFYKVEDQGKAVQMGQWYSSGGQAFVCISDNPSGGPDPQNLESDWAAMPWRSHPTKINVNTATFGQLVAAYEAILLAADGWENGNASKQLKPPGDVAPAAAAFASTLNRRQMVKLRASLAAVNTLDLRDPDNDVTTRSVNLGGGVQAMVAGTERQPYITESIVHIDQQGGKPPYVAVELHNPHNVPIVMKGWKLYIRIKANIATPPPTTIDLESLVPGGVLQPRGTLVIESTDQRPDGIAVPQGDKAKEERIANVVGLGAQEMLLMRPRSESGTPSVGPAAPNTRNVYNESSDADLVAVDQLDYEGLEPPHLGTVGVRFRYARGWAKPGTPATAETAAWHCVYGGPINRQLDPDIGTKVIPNRGWVRESAEANPAYVFKVTGALGAEKKKLTGVPAGNGPDNRLKADAYADAGKNQQATFRTRLLQIAGEDTAGWGKRRYKDGAIVEQQWLYPFGYFARNGDIMQVTFVGHYRLSNGGYPVYNSVATDSAYAHDGAANGADDANKDDYAPDGSTLENIGRFCPITLADADPRKREDDFNYYAAVMDNKSPGGVPNRYAFAIRLLDFLTVQGPQSDYMADVDPVDRDPDQPTAGPKWYPVLAENDKPLPPLKPEQIIRTATANGPIVTRQADANRGNEDSAGVEGLININTAPWRVLATLPWSPGNDNEKLTRAQNILIAQAIVYYRDVDDNLTDGGAKTPHGPFRSIYELAAIRNVPVIDAILANKTPDYAAGDLSPYVGGDDQVYGGFESQFLMLNRVSNMITTRSDSFTVYVLVQGWRGSNTGTPELVVQRRVAAIVDRTTLKPGPATGTTEPATMTIIPQY